MARSDSDPPFSAAWRASASRSPRLEYANRQGVLHRDVKPSNLLLDPKGNVWVADFGLAKASDTEDITHSGDIVGTVRYMAPERFPGKCDARSDVYALGLTLYELLALRPAFSAADRHELMRRVMSEDPERCEGGYRIFRGTSTRSSPRRSREPAERYASAAALAEDLQRFLDDKPIRARRITAGEQAWRWARRNPLVTSLAAGLLVALLGGLVAVSWQWRQAVANLAAAESANRKAQARFDLAMEAVRAFTTGASEDVILKEKALEGLRRKLLGQSQLFYEKLRVSLEAETDRSSRSALAEALSDAASLYTKVDAPQKALDASTSRWDSRGVDAGAAGRHRGDAQTSAAPPGARLLALHPGAVRRGAGRDRPARVVVEPLAREHPGDGGVRWLEAECDSLEGAALSYSVRTAPAIEALRQARAGFEALVRDNPPYTLPTAADGPTEYRRGLAHVLHWIGWTLVDVGDFAGVLEAGREQQEVVASLVAGPFAADIDRLDLAKADRLIGFNLWALGRHDEAISSLRQALAVARQVADANPTSAAYRAELALGLKASVEGISTSLASTRRCALEALATVQSLPPAQRDRYELVKVESNCGMFISVCAAAAGRMDEALRYARQSVDVCEKAARTHPDSPFFVTNFLAGSLFNLAMVELGAGRPEAALRVAESASEAAEKAVVAHPQLQRTAAT